jgi:hypothetical protein
METSSAESLSMMISTRSANWCGGINRVCEVCANTRTDVRWRMTSPRTLSCA